MDKVTYRIVSHNEGWAYEVDGSYSETFATRDQAIEAAKDAARSQRAPGDTEPVSYQDEHGRVHREIEPGRDRPDTQVENPEE